MNDINLFACNDEEVVNEPCPAVGYQTVDVCVPVVVTPSANTSGPTTTTCCGKPVVTNGTSPCAGTKNGTCTFYISQKICVAVPVEFSAKAEVLDTYVDCGDASADDICKNCDKTPDEA